MLYGRPRGPGACRSCGGETHRFIRLSTAYVYLLGLYLGDGTISKARRGVCKLRVFLDMKYPDIVAECEAAMLAVLPFNRVSRILKPSNCYEVYAYSKSWPVRRLSLYKYPWKVGHVVGASIRLRQRV